MNQLLRILTIAVLLGGTVGCRSMVANTIDIAPRKEPTVSIKNSGLDDDVTIKSAVANYVGENMEVVVTLENQDSSDHAIEYVAKWFEESKFIMNGDDQPWITTFLVAGEEKQLKLVSPSAGATNCKVLVRYGKTD